ncbi:MAG: signal peptidase [Acidimicrobiales bacterium]|nr:signal peptidase [Acidimicrobiales bacterium]
MDSSSTDLDQPTPSASRRWLGRARTVASVVGTLVCVALFIPTGLGGRVTWIEVSGHSMEPTYHTYDLALTVRVTPKIGDVIVYRVPAGQPGAGHQVIHRVIGGDAVHGYTTKGDNREGPDIWHPRRGDVIGRVVGIVPQGGRWLARLVDLHNLGLVALALLVWALWPRASDGDDDADGADGDGDAAVGSPAEPVPTSGATADELVPA